MGKQDKYGKIIVAALVEVKPDEGWNEKMKDR
jgi:hypothetical protein